MRAHEAGALHGDLGVDVVIVTVYRAALHRARMAGVRVEMANLLSDYVVRDMDLAGLKTFVAATDQDERNTIAAREFSHILGRAHVFQLAVAPAHAMSSIGLADPNGVSRLCPSPAPKPSLDTAKLWTLSSWFMVS